MLNFKPTAPMSVAPPPHMAAPPGVAPASPIAAVLHAIAARMHGPRPGMANGPLGVKPAAAAPQLPPPAMQPALKP